MIACFVAETIGIGCERARLPHLWGEPFALAAENNQLIAVSPESYPYGVRAGQGATFARTLCQGLIVLPYDKSAYLKAAEAVWDVIAVETSIIEPLSPEIVFADFSGPDIARRARTIAAQLTEALGLDVRVGLGASKIVAQHAARRSDGSRIVVAAGREAALLASVPLASLPMIAPKTRIKADKLGLKTLGDVLATPRAELERQFKTTAFLMRRLAVGEDGDSVRPLWPPLSVSRAVNFDDEVTDQRFIDHAMMTCATRIAKVLVRDSKFCRIAQLDVEMSDRTSVSSAEELKDPIRDPVSLQRAGERLYQRMTLTAPIGRWDRAHSVGIDHRRGSSADPAGRGVVAHIRAAQEPGCRTRPCEGEVWYPRYPRCETHAQGAAAASVDLPAGTDCQRAGRGCHCPHRGSDANLSHEQALAPCG